LRAVVQRVSAGAVSAPGEQKRAIGPGLVVLLGVGSRDDEADAAYLADKVANLRIFEDNNGKMNLSVLDTGGQVLVVSQFTLYGDCRRGRRPSFGDAAPPDRAVRLYEVFIDKIRSLGLQVVTGFFQSHMSVEIINDGPVTILLDSKKLF